MNQFPLDLFDAQPAGENRFTAQTGIAGADERQVVEGTQVLAQIIVAVTPIFFLLIALELIVGLRRSRNTYRLNDALGSIGLGIMSQLSDVFAKALVFGASTPKLSAACRRPSRASWDRIAAMPAR